LTQLYERPNDCAIGGDTDENQPYRYREQEKDGERQESAVRSITDIAVLGQSKTCDLVSLEVREARDGGGACLRLRLGRRIRLLENELDLAPDRGRHVLQERIRDLPSKDHRAVAGRFETSLTLDGACREPEGVSDRKSVV
jgi:hypothetical protein